MNAHPGAARRRRTAGLGAIAVAAALLTSACAAGRVAQTQNQRPSVSGVNADIGAISIRNLTVEAPPQGPSFPKDSALRLIAVFVNNGTASDLLTDISSASFTSWGAYSSVTAGDEVVAAAGSTSPTAVPTAEPVPTSEAGSATSTPTTSTPQASRTVRIPANGRTSYGVPDATGTLLALGTKTTIYPGSIVTMTLTFARAGTVTVRVPVNVTSDPTQSTLPDPSGSGGSEGG
ncbi:hypothetical protein [uncultured Jatrophihabitans sp.]|uniref:hypothetical protein n=1 Tax=uncultured Jatrophihabitans sp. TaxID=1610747 RepID=UPI0035C9E4DA